MHLWEQPALPIYSPDPAIQLCAGLSGLGRVQARLSLTMCPLLGCLSYLDLDEPE